MALPTVVKAWTASGTSTASFSNSPPSAVAAGNHVIVLNFGRRSSAIAFNALSSSLGDTGQVDAESHSSVQGAGIGSIYLPSGLGTGDSLTLGFSAAVSSVVCVFAEVSGLDTTTWKDIVSAGTTNTGTTINGPSITPTAGDRITFTLFGDLTSKTFSSIGGTPSTWTHEAARLQISGPSGIDGAYLIATADGTTAWQAAITYSASSTSNTRQLAVSYKAAAGGGGSALTQSVNDSVTMSDALASGRGLGLADSVTMSDALAFARGLVLGDTLNLADTVALHIGLALADSVTMSDSATPNLSSGGTHWTQSINDSVTLADAVAFGRKLALGDAVTMSDTLKFARALHLNDSVVLSDLIALGRGLHISDTVTMADAIAFGRSITLSDAVALTETLAFGHGLSLDDAVSVFDHIAVTLDGQPWPPPKVKAHARSYFVTRFGFYT